MSHRSFSGGASEIRSEACAWIAQIETGDMTRADVASLQEWLRRSPQHASEIRKLAALSADLNVLTELAGPLKDAAAHYREVIPVKRARRWALGWAAALSLAGGVAAALFLRTSDLAETQDWPLILATAVGEYREAELPDGSMIALNTDSRLEVEYDEDRRVVRLLGGEALFTVARNPARPFVVFAGGRQIRAVGTAFLVRVEPESLEVAVTEGKVLLGDLAALAADGAAPAVSPSSRDAGEAGEGAAAARSAEKSDAPPADVVLRAGQSWKASEEDAGLPPKVETVSRRELQRKLAWRDGLLDFSDTPLEEVIRDVSRYTTLTIEVADPELRDLKFGGLFRVEDTRPLFIALQDNYGIKVEYVDADTVRLTRSDGG